MSAAPPLTAKEITDIITRAIQQKNDLHARIHVSRGTTVIPDQAVKEEFFNAKVEIDVPPDDPKIIDAVHKVKADLETLVGEFKAAHLSKALPSKTAQSPSLPYNIEKIKWLPNKFDVGDYAFSDHVEAKQLVEVLKNAGKPVEISGQEYSLNKAGTYIYRKPAGAK